MVGRVAVPLEGNLPSAALGAALQLLHLRPEVDVLAEVELLGEAARWVSMSGGGGAL